MKKLPGRRLTKCIFRCSFDLFFFFFMSIRYLFFNYSFRFGEVNDSEQSLNRFLSFQFLSCLSSLLQ